MLLKRCKQMDVFAKGKTYTLLCMRCNTVGSHFHFLGLSKIVALVSRLLAESEWQLHGLWVESSLSAETNLPSPEQRRACGVGEVWGSALRSKLLLSEPKDPSTSCMHAVMRGTFLPLLSTTVLEIICARTACIELGSQGNDTFYMLSSLTICSTASTKNEKKVTVQAHVLFWNSPRRKKKYCSQTEPKEGYNFVSACGGNAAL